MKYFSVVGCVVFHSPFTVVQSPQTGCCYSAHSSPAMRNNIKCNYQDSTSLSSTFLHDTSSDSIKSSKCLTDWLTNWLTDWMSGCFCLVAIYNAQSGLLIIWSISKSDTEEDEILILIILGNPSASQPTVYTLQPVLPTCLLFLWLSEIWPAQPSQE